MPEVKEVLISIRNMTVSYETRLGAVSAVDGVSFDIFRGEILGLVGESGCGKSTLGKGLMRLMPSQGSVHGEIFFGDQDILKFTDDQMRDFRGRRISMIFQDPMTSLNPVQRIDEHLIEAIQVHEPQTNKMKALDRVKKLIERMGIQSNRLSSYPHQLSGGMRQRVMISLGLVLNASLIVADEATTSLDVIVEAKLVDEIKKIRNDFGVSILMITHNIALVANIADRLAVMYAGRMAEIGPIEQLFANPLHPYTQGLLACVPSIEIKDNENLYKMPGEPPNLTHPPSGCRFHPRCPYVMPVCKELDPKLVEGVPDQFVNCWLYQEQPVVNNPESR